MTENVKHDDAKPEAPTWGLGPSGGEEERLTSENPEWHETSSCCGASETGVC
jgi:hypothetical protein